MYVLGLETSCDETGVAIVDGDANIIAETLDSQIELHAQYGGVVPELASRDHIRKALPLINETLAQANLDASQITGVAYTAGPGLIGALLVGASLGRSLAMGWNVPAIGVHHMEGHLLAVMLDENPPEFPFIALLVSGGHTMLVKVADFGHYEVLGGSLDDAVGEAFDKTAKLMGLPYPGGPELAKIAVNGDPNRFTFPRPMVNRPGLDFSFSGLKTFAMNTYNSITDSDQDKADIARAFEESVCQTLAIKCKRALKQEQITTLVVAGGVAANTRLRAQLHELSARVCFPQPQYCTDNGVMIANAGMLRLKAGQKTDLEIAVRPRWSLEELEVPA